MLCNPISLIIFAMGESLPDFLGVFPRDLCSVHGCSAWDLTQLLRLARNHFPQVSEIMVCSLENVQEEA